MKVIVLCVLFCTLSGLMATGGQLLGGRKSHDISELHAFLSEPFDGENGKVYGELLHDDLVKLNKESNSMYVYKIAGFLKYETQVVAGILHIITVDLAPTGCRKNNFLENGREEQHNLLATCEVDEKKGHHQKYEFRILVKAWEKGDDKVDVTHSLVKE